MDKRDIDRISGWWTCPACGKRSYPTKSRAKYAARLLRDQGLRVYRCADVELGDASPWHVGHLPVDIISGRRARGTGLVKRKANERI